MRQCNSFLLLHRNTAYIIHTRFASMGLIWHFGWESLSHFPSSARKSSFERAHTHTHSYAIDIFLIHMRDKRTKINAWSSHSAHHTLKWARIAEQFHQPHLIWIKCAGNSEGTILRHYSCKSSQCYEKICDSHSCAVLCGVFHNTLKFDGI